MKSHAGVAGGAQGETAGSANHSETSPETSRQEVVAPAKAVKRPGPVRRFFWSLISHVVFASVIVAGVLGYLYQRQILTRIGDELCSDARLGQYMTKPRGIAEAAPPLPSVSQAPGASPMPPTAAAAPAAASLPPTASSPPPAAPAGATTATPPVTETPAAPPASTPVTEPPAASSASPAVEAATPEAEPKPTPPPSSSDTTTAIPFAPPSPEATHLPVATIPVESPPASVEAAVPPPVVPAGTAPNAETVQPSVPPPAIAEAAPATDKPTQLATAEPPSPEPAASAASFNPAALNSEWQAARRAYLEGQPGAADEYRTLVSKYPDIADLRGELGNVLYAGGHVKEAADQYYEAALRHLKGPQPELAACLLDIVRKLNPERGEELQKRVTHACPYPQGK